MVDGAKKEVARPSPPDFCKGSVVLFEPRLLQRVLARGFFVCGFQVVFIATHVPAFLADKGLSAETGSLVLAFIGLPNIPGTYFAGLWGGRWRKPMLQAWRYLARVAIIGEPGQRLRLRRRHGAVLAVDRAADQRQRFATLLGVHTMFHQLGAFLGGWLGGVLYDRLGSSDLAWGVAIGLNLLAAVLNVPIKEQAVAEPAKAAA